MGLAQADSFTWIAEHPQYFLQSPSHYVLHCYQWMARVCTDTQSDGDTLSRAGVPPDSGGHPRSTLKVHIVISDFAALGSSPRL